ncbi:hypothetical protein B0T20DRAFT_486420 [Sordaria brevicollis]|uniref:F-box domain-containing protein n=1 Tax=Sordaria brevicollis TaxID=83679 RepID=A0AAE0UHP4_SORBR|nr:hypothetical protein B0T20DRAFT_486420 [Sordaria brevicollis]
MTTQAHSPEAYLTRIPQEVLTRITYFIRTPDLCNARLTCRALEKALFHSFAYEFFRKKQFMVYSPSLQCLVDISKHESLSPYLKHVIIGLDQVIRPNPYHPPPGDQRWLNWQLAYADQQALLCSGRARDMLAEAFKNLPDLETVDLRDFHSTTRWRDDGAGWTSYGYNTLVESTGVRHSTGGPTTNDDADYPTRLFTVITHALAAAKARPQGIEVVIRENWGILDHGFFVPTYLQPDYLPVLAGLKKLHLVLELQPSRHQTGTTSGSYLLRRFLAYTPNLTWLRINLKRYGTDNVNGEALLKWLASSSRPGSWSSPDSVNGDPSLVPPPVELDHLEQLDLGQLHVSTSTLYRLFRKFSPTLKAISLHRIRLRHHFDQSSFDDNDDDEERNPWVRLLRKLKKESLPHLKTLLLSFLSAQVTTDTGVTIHYPEVGFVDPDRVETQQQGTPAPGYQTLKGVVHLIRSRTYSGLELETFLSNPAAEFSTPSKEISGPPDNDETSESDSDSDDGIPSDGMLDDEGSHL